MNNSFFEIRYTAFVNSREIFQASRSSNRSIVAIGLHFPNLKPETKNLKPSRFHRVHFQLLVRYLIRHVNCQHFRALDTVPIRADGI